MNHLRRLINVSAFLACAALAPGAAAANLLSNGEFSSFTTSPWSVSQGKLFLSALDRQNNPGSGSALVVDDNGYFLAASLLSECVRISGGANASVTAYLKAGTKNPAGSKVRVGRFYYSDTSCGTYISGANTGFLSVSSSWTKISHASTAPGSAKSVKVEIVANSGGEAVFEMLADGIQLGSSSGGSPAPIFADDFDSGSPTGWAVFD